MKSVTRHQWHSLKFKIIKLIWCSRQNADPNMNIYVSYSDPNGTDRPDPEHDKTQRTIILPKTRWRHLPFEKNDDTECATPRHDMTIFHWIRMPVAKEHCHCHLSSSYHDGRPGNADEKQSNKTICIINEYECYDQIDRPFGANSNISKLTTQFFARDLLRQTQCQINIWHQSSSAAEKTDCRHALEKLHLPTAIQNSKLRTMFFLPPRFFHSDSPALRWVLRCRWFLRE